MWRILMISMLALAVSGCGLVADTVLTVDEGEVAVIFDATTGQMQEPRGPGVYIIAPIDAPFVYSMLGQTYRAAGEDVIGARAGGGASLEIELQVIYRIDPDGVTTLHTRYGQAYEASLIAPMVRRVVREVAVQQTPDQLRADDGAALAALITDALREQLAVENIIVEQVMIDGLGLPE